MEYKYHPALKHLTYFVIVYLFLKHQNIMSTEILLANSVVLTLFILILDHIFISGHLTPFESLDDQYFDTEEINKLKEDIEIEEEDLELEEKKIKKDKKKKHKKNKRKQDLEKTVELQNYHENQIVEESQFIKNNHPNNFSDKCVSHSEFVNITNGLDNFNSNTSNKFNTYQDEIYTDYKAYNE